MDIVIPNFTALVIGLPVTLFRVTTCVYLLFVKFASETAALNNPRSPFTAHSVVIFQRRSQVRNLILSAIYLPAYYVSWHEEIRDHVQKIHHLGLNIVLQREE